MKEGPTTSALIPALTEVASPAAKSLVNLLKEPYKSKFRPMALLFKLASMERSVASQGRAPRAWAGLESVVSTPP